MQGTHALVRIKSSTIHGRGVFAAQTINPGRLVMSRPFIRVDGTDGLPDPLDRYVFESDREDVALLCLGELSLLNHDDEPNCEVIEDDRSDTFHLFALRRIQVNEELTISYPESLEDTGT